jgi:hypothetical protein
MPQPSTAAARAPLPLRLRIGLAVSALFLAVEEVTAFQLSRPPSPMNIDSPEAYDAIMAEVRRRGLVLIKVLGALWLSVLLAALIARLLGRKEAAVGLLFGAGYALLLTFNITLTRGFILLCYYLPAIFLLGALASHAMQKPGSRRHFLCLLAVVSVPIVVVRLVSGH